MDKSTAVLFHLIIQELNESDPTFKEKLAKKIDKALHTSLSKEDKKPLENFLVSLRK